MESEEDKSSALTELEQIQLAPGKYLVDLDPPTRVSKSGIISKTPFFALDDQVIRGNVVAVGVLTEGSKNLYAVGDRVIMFSGYEHPPKIQLDGNRYFLFDEFGIYAKTAQVSGDIAKEIEESKKGFYDKLKRESEK